MKKYMKYMKYAIITLLVLAGLQVLTGEYARALYFLLVAAGAFQAQRMQEPS